MTNPLTPPPMTDADQNPIKKPLTLRLADRLVEGITTGHDWPNTNDELLRLQCAATLRTQHALLERARAALSHSNPSEPIWKTPHREAIAAITQHLEPKP